MAAGQSNELARCLENPGRFTGNKTKTEAGIAIECMEDLEGAGYVKFEHNVACTHWQD